MRRAAVVFLLGVAAALGLSLPAEAQCLITPLGPLAVRPPALPKTDPFQEIQTDVFTTPVARRGEGPHWALPPREYRRGARHAAR